MKFLLVTWSLILISPIWSAIKYYLYQDGTPVLANKIVYYALSVLQKVYPYAIFLTFLVVFIFFIIYGFKQQRQKAISSILVSILSFVSATAIDFSISWGNLKYPNYLYSEFGLRTEDLMLVKNILTILGIIGIFLALYVHSKSVFQGTLISKRTLFLFGLSLFVFKATYPLTNAFSLIQIRNQDYHNKIGEDYKYIESLHKYVPESAVIVLPPQSSTWPAVGNQPVTRYFVYPRTLISGDYVDNLDSVFKRGDEVFFVLIPSTESRPVWPYINPEKNEITFGYLKSLKYTNLEKVTIANEPSVYKLTF